MLQRRDEELLDASLASKLKRQGLVFNSCDSSTFRTALATAGFYARWKAEYGQTAWDLMERYAGKIG
jgi:hypothetical protein